MIHLVLNAAGKDAIALQGVGDAMQILETDGDFVRADDVAADFGERKATLLIGLLSEGRATTAGLTKVIGMISSSGVLTPSSTQVKFRFIGSKSTTQSCSARPICWAASPMPSASCMVATISWTRFASSVSKTVTLRPFCLRMGSLK
jgi:hypothetical protein